MTMMMRMRRRGECTLQNEKRRRLPCQAGELNDDDDDEKEEEVYTAQGKEVAEITLPGRRRKLVTATGYSPTSDSGESNLGTSFVMQNTKYKI